MISLTFPTAIETTINVIWVIAVALVVLYSMLYGLSWTHAGEIKYPLLLYVLVVTSLMLPAALLALSLPRRVIRGASAPDEAVA